jgi:hypothetical protein
VAHANDEDVVYDAAQKRVRGVLGFRRTWASKCLRCDARIAGDKRTRST